MRLTFPATLPRYHRSGLSFIARDGSRTVEFWMTATAFGKRFGHRDHDTGKAIGTFERNRNAIEQAASLAYDGRRREGGALTKFLVMIDCALQHHSPRWS